MERLRLARGMGNGRLAVKGNESPGEVKVDSVATGLGEGQVTEASAEGVCGVFRREGVKVFARAPAPGMKSTDFVEGFAAVFLR